MTPSSNSREDWASTPKLPRAIAACAQENPDVLVLLSVFAVIRGAMPRRFGAGRRRASSTRCRGFLK